MDQSPASRRNVRAFSDASPQTRPKNGNRKARRALVGKIGFTISAVVVAAITLTSATTSSFHPPVARGVRFILAELGVVLTRGEFDVVANVIMFAPLGLFLGLMLPVRRYWVGYLLLPLASAAIEFTQLFLPTRGTQLTDFLANSFGAWIGLSLAWLYITVTERRHQR